MQPITRLCALCEVTFEKELYGSHATGKVMKEISKKRSRKNIFLP